MTTSLSWVSTCTMVEDGIESLYLIGKYMRGEGILDTIRTGRIEILEMK